MALLMLHDAEVIAQKGRPWSIRLEFIGVNANNKNGVSDKYWYASGRGLKESLEIGWGAVGKKPQTQLVTWVELKNRVPDKLAKGYMYVNHPYIRMSAGNIAKILGQAPVPPSRPLTATPVKNTKQVLPPPQPQILAGQLALGKPWCLICSLQVVRVGTKVTGLRALDKKGGKVLMFDEDGGLEFARDHNLDILFT